MDRRTKKGMRALNVWVTRELADVLDKERDLAPMQRFVVRLLEEALAARIAARRGARAS